jgi:hypothetical protein
MTSRQRRVPLLGVVLLGLLAVLGSLLVLHALEPTPGVTVQNYLRLRVGMSEREIEGILGRPGNPMLEGRSVYGEIWSTDKFLIIAVFNREGCLVEGGIDRLANDYSGPVGHIQEDKDIFDRLRRLLRL